MCKNLLSRLQGSTYLPLPVKLVSLGSRPFPLVLADLACREVGLSSCTWHVGKSIPPLVLAKMPPVESWLLTFVLAELACWEVGLPPCPCRVGARQFYGEVGNVVLHLGIALKAKETEYKQTESGFSIRQCTRFWSR